MNYSGDWMCGSCQHMNFKKRDTCQRCGYSKFGGGTDVSRVLAGDWYCAAMNCGAHNYASRTNCYRCGASNMTSSVSYGSDSKPRPGWMNGDWICTRCTTHNYARRTECHGCNTPKDYCGAV